MVRRLLVVAIATFMTAGAVATGVPSASAADPLQLVPVNPGGATSGQQRTLPDAVRGHAYSFQLTATGGQPSYTFEAEYPQDFARYGLSLSSSGLISGTIIDDPSYAVITGFTLFVHDVAGTTIREFLGITIQPDFRITTASLPDGTARTPYAAQLAATAGTAPFLFKRGSTLPAGLKLSKTGLLSGVPKWGGEYSVTINVKDAAGSSVHFASRTYDLSIAGAPKPGGGGTGGGGPVPNFAATGDLACSGGVTIAAKGQGGSPPHVIMQLKGRISCSGGTGDARVTIKFGKVTGGYGLGQVCSVLGDKPSGSNATFLPFSIEWKTRGGSISGTQIGFNGHRATSNGWQLPIPDGTGTSQVTGSYAGVGTAAMGIGASTAQIQSLCQGASPAAVKVTGSILITL